MNGSVFFFFFKGGYMNRVGTPVPKLPQSYRPLPHPKVWSECAIAVALLIPLWTVRLSKVNTISECSDQNVQLRRLTRVFACRTRRFVTSRDYRRYIWLAKALIRLLMCRFRVCMLTWLFIQILLLVLPYTHSCAKCLCKPLRSTLSKIFNRHFEIFFSFFNLTFHANCLHCMKCQILFSIAWSVKSAVFWEIKK